MLIKKTQPARKSKQASFLTGRLIHLFKHSQPQDITSAAGPEEEEAAIEHRSKSDLSAQPSPESSPELEPVIIDLVSGQSVSRRPRSRHLRVIRIVAAIVIPGLIIAGIILVPAWQNRQSSPVSLKVIFSNTHLGNLALSSWSDDTIQQEIYSGFGPPLYYGSACYAKSFELGVCGDQHLSFVDNLGNLYSWNKSTGILTRETSIKPSATSASTLAWSWLYPGQYILAHVTNASGNDMYQIRDVIRDRLLYTGSTPLFSLASDGRWIAAYGGQQQIQIIDGLYGEGVAHILSSPYFAHLVALSWSPDTTEMATASADGTIQLWDVFHSTLLATWNDLTGGMPAPASTTQQNDRLQIAWSPSGQYLAAASVLAGKNQPVHIWSTATTRLVAGHNSEQEAPLSSINWLDSGMEVLTSSSSGAELWNASTGQTIARLTTQQIAAEPGYYTSPVVLNEALLAIPSGSNMQVLDMRTGKLLQTLSNEESNNAFIATSWNPEVQTYPIAVDRSGDLLIWQMHPWQLAAHYQLPCTFTGQNTATSISLSWSPDGKLLAVDCGNQGLIVLEIST